MEENHPPPPLRRKKKIVNGMKKQIKNMSKEAIQATILKKKECNEKAIKIVERLIEPNVDQFWMLENLRHINQSHFDDVVEERSIIHTCGYPLCDKGLGKVPNKQYQISTKQNKVYDITDRKRYCSNICYKSGRYVKDQLFTSPLWMRDCEDSTVYQLYSHQNNTCVSGEELDIGITDKIKVENIEREEADVSSSTYETADEDFSESKEELEDFIRRSLEQAMSEMDCSDSTTETEKRNEAKEKEVIKEEKVIKQEAFEKPMDLGSELPDLNEVPNKTEEKPPNKVVMKRVKMRAPPCNKKKPALSMQELIITIERKIRSWFTFDTLVFLLGEDRVRELLVANGSTWNQLSFKNNSDPYMYERYMDICRKLNILELKEETETGDGSPTAEKRPLPDYKELQREAREMEIKVRSFYKAEESPRVTFEEHPEAEVEDDATPNPVIPIVDHYAMKAARRKIILNQLSKSLPDIQRALNLSSYNIGVNLKELVSSLNLTPTNIIFRPSEWSLVAIVVIKLLTLRDPYLFNAFQSETVHKYLLLILMSYNLDLAYLDRLVCWLTDVAYLLNSEPVSTS